MPPGEAPRNWNVVARSVDVPMVVWYGPLLIGQICDSSGSSLGHCDRHEQRGGRNQIRKPQKHKGGLAHLSRLRSSPRTEVEMRRFMAESMDRALTPVPYCALQVASQSYEPYGRDYALSSPDLGSIARRQKRTVAPIAAGFEPPRQGDDPAPCGIRPLVVGPLRARDCCAFRS